MKHAAQIDMERRRASMARMIADYYERGQKDPEDAQHFVNMQAEFIKKFHGVDWRHFVEDKEIGR